MREKIEELIQDYRDRANAQQFPSDYGDEDRYYDGRDSGERIAYSRVADDLEYLLRELGE